MLPQGGEMMPRRTHPKTARRVVAVPPTVEPPPIAGAVAIPTPEAVGGQSLETPTGRPRRSYKAEVEELRSQLARERETKIEPRDLLGVTAGLLQIMAASIKGDDPTGPEVERCNEALVGVA